jgi:lysophospholipase L1-like esterase
MSLTYLALGDSYTIGEAVPIQQNFPFQAVQILKEKGVTISDPEIIAITGWTTADLLAAIEEKKPKNNYSIVTLLIGVNNQYQGKDIEQYRSEFETLLNDAIQFAKNSKEHVFVLSIPDYGVTPFAKEKNSEKIGQELDIYNAINKEISLTKGVNYIDITPVSRQGAIDPSMQAEDGLHPSAKQYAEWAKMLALEMIKRLTA